MSDIDRKIAEFVGCTVWMNDGSFAGAKYKGELIAHSELGLRNWLISSDGMRAMMEGLGQEGVAFGLIQWCNVGGKDKVNIKLISTKGFWYSMEDDLLTAVYEAVKAYVEMK